MIEVAETMIQSFEKPWTGKRFHLKVAFPEQARCGAKMQWLGE